MTWAGLTNGPQSSDCGIVSPSALAVSRLMTSSNVIMRKVMAKESTASARPNGPYLVEGEVELYDPAGNKVDTTGRARIALCRCGGLVTKPFCERTHSKIGFQAVEVAVTQKQQ